MLNQKQRLLNVWLWTGLVMIMFQIVLGGITRLTGSGLSITKWDIVVGIVYPYNEEVWNREFDLYKQTPQYQKINRDFDLKQFKWIYFWEYLHRLWARCMGLVFVIPLVFFIKKGWIERNMAIRLGIIIVLAAAVASLGWIMVASGLIDYPWVNAFKLSFHLSAAAILLSFVFVTILWHNKYEIKWSVNRKYKWIVGSMVVLYFLQIFLGGLVAGMKASLAAPTWPDLNGSYWIQLTWSEVMKFLYSVDEQNAFRSIFAQWLHRNLAYTIGAISLFGLWYIRKEINDEIRKCYYVYLVLLGLQMFFGIFTVLNSYGKIPLFWAAIHQLNGFVSLLWIIFMLHKK